MIKDCGYSYSKSKHLTGSLGALFLFKCSDFTIQNSVIECDYKQCGVAIFSAIGNVRLNNIRSGQLLIIQTYTTSDVTVEISYYEQSICTCCVNDTAMKVTINQHLYTVIVVLSHIKLNIYKPIIMHCSSCEGQNLIVIKEMQLLGTVFSQYIIDITLSNCVVSKNIQFGNKVLFIDCHIFNISGTGVIFNAQASMSTGYAIVQISNSSFSYIKSDLIIQTIFDCKFSEHRTC